MRSGFLLVLLSVWLVVSPGEGRRNHAADRDARPDTEWATLRVRDPGHTAAGSTWRLRVVHDPDQNRKAEEGVSCSA